MPVTEDGRDPWPMPELGWPAGCSIVSPAPPTAAASGAPPHPPLLAATPLPVPLGDAEAGAPTATPLSAATVAQDLARDAYVMGAGGPAGAAGGRGDAGGAAAGASAAAAAGAESIWVRGRDRGFSKEVVKGMHASCQRTVVVQPEGA